MNSGAREPFDEAITAPLRSSLRQLSLAAGLAHLRADLIQRPYIALRAVDQAWRSPAASIATLAPIYGRLFMLAADDYQAALRLLQRTLELAPDADAAALMALALLRLQRVEEARAQMAQALAQYCVVPGGLLSAAASEVLRQCAGDVAGWIGRDPALQLVGALSPDEPTSVLDITTHGQPVCTQLLRNLPRHAPRAFSFAPPPLDPSQPLEVSVRGRALLGGTLHLPQDFALDGRAHTHGRRLTGWSRLGWLPTRPPRLRITADNGAPRTLRTARLALAGWRWSFTMDLRAAQLRAEQLQVSAQLPDGRWQCLPDAPLLPEPMVRRARRRLRRWSVSPARARPSPARHRSVAAIDVIIPVYRGREQTLACLDCVLATVAGAARIVVVDDASDDAELAASLDALAAAGRITLLRNAVNQGFVASVNRAMALSTTHDVVLLNSDTQVFDDWLPRLRRAAYSSALIGTVTPLSNDGSIASYPRADGALIDPEDGRALHALAAATHSGTRAALPVGVGFCLYIRRDCLRQVGTLDAALFGKGYGEETDFCLRARQHGWSHLLAADVFVYHAGGGSFGTRRAALLERSQRLINLRHPGYDAYIASFKEQDPLHGLRRRLDEQRLRAFEGRFVLLVTLALSGGVDRFVAERCQSLRTRGLWPLLLRPAAADDAQRCRVWTEAMAVPNLCYDIPAQLSELSALLGSLRLESIEIQHFLHLDARLIEAVRALPVPYDVFVHDYAWICPRVTLIDGSGRYCGEPAVKVCQTCIRRNGSHLGEAITVPALRARSERWLRGAQRVFAPSTDTAARLQRHFPALSISVQPHSTPGVAASGVAASDATIPIVPVKPGTVRVALIGAIGDHKGYRLLLECARDARRRRLPLEFIVIGYSQQDAPLLATGNVFITGRYSEVEAPHLLHREQPHVAWFASVWPETWCYALDYALEAALPIVAFDLGAVAERLRAAGTGMLLPLGLDARDINDQLLQWGGGQPAPRAKPRRYVQTSHPRARDDAKIRLKQQGENKMSRTANGTAARNGNATREAPISKAPGNKAPGSDASTDGLSASAQVLPLPSGLYLFSVKAASPSPATANGAQIALPAVHVCAGPGVPAEQVEFIAGPATQGTWLSAPGDVLVTRINGAGATLVVTSMRAPGGDVLAIQVERLESRAAAADAGTSGTAAGDAPADDQALPLKIAAHIRKRGDVSFSGRPWAGRVAPGLWIESFAVRPLQGIAASDLEYKGLTGSGFETPWLSDDKMCGTKGMAVPLVGFALRLKPGAAAGAYDCEYSGYFQSGVTVGPLRNGAPCRSNVANDPLEGIQIRIVKRPEATVSAVAARKSAVPARATPRDKRGAPGAGRRQATRRP